MEPSILLCNTEVFLCEATQLSHPRLGIISQNIFNKKLKEPPIFLDRHIYYEKYVAQASLNLVLSPFHVGHYFYFVNE